MNRIKHAFVIVALCGTVACVGDAPTLPGDLGDGAGGQASGGEDNTYDHPGTEVDVWALLDRLQQEGPPRYTSRVHSCPKVTYETVGRILVSLGVDVQNAADLSAGQLYRDGASALGAPNYAARARESRDLSTAGASRLYDIFVAAAPEIIANMPNMPNCQVGGQPAELFSASNQCLPDGISCLIGYPATASHLEICNLTVQRASDIETGKRMAVAVLAAAAHTCE
jgi:hypothetical protein